MVPKRCPNALKRYGIEKHKIKIKNRTRPSDRHAMGPAHGRGYVKHDFRASYRNVVARRAPVVNAQ